MNSDNSILALSMMAQNKEFFMNNYLKVKHFINELPEYINTLWILHECYEKELAVTSGHLKFIMKSLNINHTETKYVLDIITEEDITKVDDLILLKSLEDEFIKRETHKLGSKIDESTTADKFVDKSTILSYISNYIDTISIAFNDGKKLINAIKDYKDNMDNNTNIIKTGLETIDLPLNGFHRKDIYCIAADTGIGKTVLALQLAYMLSLLGYKVGFYTIEMGNDELVERIASSKIKYSINALKFDNTKHKNLKKIMDVMEDFHIKHESELYFHEDLTNFMDIKASISRNSYDIVFIDYWQLLDYGGVNIKFDNRNLELSEIARESKLFSKTRQIPIIWLAQLTSKQVKASGYMPDKSQLRDSTSLANDATSMMMIHRPEYYGIETFNGKNTKGKAWIIFDKNRHGISTMIMSGFNGNAMQYYDIKEEIDGFKAKVTKPSGQTNKDNDSESSEEE